MKHFPPTFDTHLDKELGGKFSCDELKNALERSPNSKLTHIPPAKQPSDVTEMDLQMHGNEKEKRKKKKLFYFFQLRTCNMGITRGRTCRGSKQSAARSLEMIREGSVDKFKKK